MTKQLSIVIFGNTNNYPLLLAEGFIALGHRVRLILNRKEILHRPESKYPEWKGAYPDWVRDFSHLSDEDIAFQAPALEPLIHELTHDIDLAVLNDTGPSLSVYLKVPHVSFLTGSDLTCFADYSFLNKRSQFWDPAFKRSPGGRRDLYHMAGFVSLQRDGILSSDIVCYGQRGLIPEGDRLLDEIGVSDPQRMMVYLSDVIRLKPHPAPQNKNLIILNGSRIVFRPDANPFLGAIDFKGTDVLLNGYAEYCRRGGTGELRMPQKGQDLKAAKEMAQNLGIAERIQWLPEMSLDAFYQEMIAADLICDQVGSSFPGMVTLDAYALGRPVLANLRNDIFKEVFPRPLPGYHVSTAQEIAETLLKAEKDCFALKNLGSESRAYAETYLSPVRMAEQLLERCRFGSNERRQELVLKRYQEQASLSGVADKFDEEVVRRLLNNPKMLRVFLMVLRFLDAVPGLTLMRSVLIRIRKKGFRAFCHHAAMKLSELIQKLKMSWLLGMQLDAPRDIRFPDKGRFISHHSLSQSAKQGKPAVCLVTVNLSSGGAERQVVGLARELKNRGFQVRVRLLRLGGENSHYLPLLQEQNVDVAVPLMPTAQDLSFMKSKGIDLSLLNHLPEELRMATLMLTLDLLRNPVDVVHCYLDWSCCYGGFAALLSGTPAVRLSWRNVNPSHFEFYRDWMPHLYGFYSSHTHVSFENNTSCGARDYADWLRIDRNRIEVMHNGIATELFSGVRGGQILNSASEPGSQIISTPESPLVLSVSRLSSEKRPLDLPEILLRLQTNVSSARMMHVGEGPLKESLRLKINNLGLSYPEGAIATRGAFILKGRRSDVFQIMQGADAFLLTSEQEGMPNVVMEAMYAGIPVVATRVGGVPDLIEDGVHGFLHDVGDLEGMARSLEKILRDPALKKRMGNAGRERILSQFTSQQLAERVISAYLSQMSEIK